MGLFRRLDATQRWTSSSSRTSSSSSHRHRHSCTPLKAQVPAPRTQQVVLAMATSSRQLQDWRLQQTGFGASPGNRLQLAVMGDLHLAPEQMPLFHDARDQILSYLCDEQGNPLPGSRVVQLGDLGHSKHESGSRSCFEFAKAFLDSFQLPYSLVLGNHDMEGDEFPTDIDNLEAWQQVWQQPHHWCADLGPCVAIGLSTTQYRSNPYSHHEVHIDDKQMQWFEDQLKQLAAENRPVIVFTHAPPMGCGLKVVQEVHVKNRCAWLNHSDRPERFIELCQRYTNIRLWLSGHFHLSHNYQDSISVIGSTAFVQTGVIGTCHRDGFRHSRLITADMTSFRVMTFEHNSPTRPPRIDLAHRWDDPSPPSILTPPDEIITGADVTGWLRSEVECSMTLGGKGTTRVTRKQQQQASWYPIGNKSILALQGQDNRLLVEYDLATRAPVGLVCKVPQGCEVVLKAADGAPPSPRGDGSDVEVVEVVDKMTGGTSKYLRNEQGTFFVVYHWNKWKIKQAKLMAERQQATATTEAEAVTATV